MTFTYQIKWCDAKQRSDILFIFMFCLEWQCIIHNWKINDEQQKNYIFRATNLASQTKKTAIYHDI